MIPKRRVEAELMDQPGLDPAFHVEALRGLQRINAVSRGATILWSPIAELAHGSRHSIACLGRGLRRRR